MLVSTRGRYALNVMMDLAENSNDDFIPLKDIAMRQNISQKYVSSIMSVLSKAGFVEAVHGKGGGYKLVKKPEQYTVASILRLTENSLATVSCLEKGSPECAKAGVCRTLPVWVKLQKVMDDYLESVTLEDLINNNI